MDFSTLEHGRYIEPLHDYTPHIGVLISSLEYARLKTMNNVAHLSVYQLDYLQDEHANCIGMLLLHMAGVEYAIQQLTFYDRKFAESLDALGEWGIALFMGTEARETVKGHPVEYYFDKMNGVRRITLDTFKNIDDEWLWKTCHWKREIITNYYWQWFHVFEDEIGHRGEINWLMSRIPPEIKST